MKLDEKAPRGGGFPRFENTPLVQGAADRLASARLAAGAFALLVFRYTRQEVLAIRMGSSRTGTSATVRLEASHDTVLSALLDQVERQIAAQYFEEPLCLSWSSPGEGELSLTVRLARLELETTRSHQEGIFVTASLPAIARHFRASIDAVRWHRSTTMGRATLLDEAERRLLLNRWSVSEVIPSITSPGLLHSIFERRARERPDQIAVICNDRQMSYADLDARAGRLARLLRARGIGPGDFIAFQLPRSLDVYVAMLGVLKAGAAYVPLDPEYPRERVAYILSDCGAKILLTLSSLVGRLAPALPVIELDDDGECELATAAPSPNTRAPASTDACYVIYTSGSTGKPKGVVIEHRSAVHLVRAEQHLFEIQPSDRVFQGFSVAFDAAVEEIWLAFAAGATLVVGTKSAIVSDLGRVLVEQRVTVMSTVPTLLSTVEGDLPTVRLLIVGGEACPQSLVDRFATDGRVMFNTYGPTEATVIATYTRLEAGKRVTIGRPVPNYTTYILDAGLQLSPAGVAGEIFIGGIGLARGYVGKSELTSARFVSNPHAAEDGAPPLLYRTGDRGRYDADGNIEFLGRLDDQVKLRGFRVELGEIEAALLDCGAAQAAVLVRRDRPGLEQLVAYVVATPSVELDVDALKEGLRARLPPHMVPAVIEVLVGMPTLTSGKVDKKSLPKPSHPPLNDLAKEDDRPRNALEETIARCWAELFGVPAVARSCDFFHDLGGHSLLAAQMVSTLRKAPELAALSVLDVYEHPTVAKLAERHARAVASCESEGVMPRASRWTHLACGSAQLLALYGVFGAYSLQWLGPYLTYMVLRHTDVRVAISFLAALGVLCAVYPLMLGIAVAAKWVIIGRYKPGHYAVWGTYYFRCWIVDNMLALAPTGFLVGSPLLNAYYRLLGARIGRNVHLGSDSMGCFDLVTVGDDSTVGIDADLRGSTIQNGSLVIGAVRVGQRCVVGSRSVLTQDVTMQDDAVLGELSLLSAGGFIGVGERWSGSPARFVSRSKGSRPVARPSPRRRAMLVAAYAVASSAMPLFVVVALLPGLALLTWLDRRVGAWFLLASPAVATIFIVLLCLEIAAAKWLLLGRVRPGRYEVHSGFFFRKWVFDQAMGLSLDELGSLYGTLFLNPWYRLLGVRLGKNSEVSTASAGAPDLLCIDEEAFIADCASIGAPWIERGLMDLRETRVGKRSFIGNSAVVPAGAVVGDDCLVGCLSIAPDDAATHDGRSWFGSPPVTIPQRQASKAFPAEATYRPTHKRVAQRLAFESLRVTLPTTCSVFLSCLLIRVSLALSDRIPVVTFVALFPLLYVSFGLLAAVIVIALKWTIVGRYRPGEHPLWSAFVWRTELVTAMHESLANPFFVDKLDGTPFIAWFFRALGAKIGDRVYMRTTELTEYDLVTVGDEACLNEDCTLQTHLFEDRVMKMSTVHVGARCTVGSDAVVLYDTEMEEGSSLGSLSLLMKGETLPAGSSWEGSPARLVGHKERKV